ncbi:MAG TPA: hypothetical protein VNE62_09355 [Actinomycetota bacterium]|nr:hypothetical protein [Actinomycetota bacterium]
MRALAALVMAIALLTGCGPAQRAPERATSPTPPRGALAPSLAPLPDTARPPAPQGTASARAGAPAAAGAETAPAATGAAATADRVSEISDPAGDLTPSAQPPPPHADLTGASLRLRDGYELRVRLAGPAPDRGPDDRTQNIASFYDTDGDGQFDFEVWANLADNGWAGSYFGRGPARFGAASGVQVSVERGELLIRFSSGHLEDAASFRWALASEWGPYEVISTPAAARDSAPDSGAASFSG